MHCSKNIFVERESMKKAILIGNGFTAHIIDAYSNEKMKERLFNGAEAICSKAEKLFLPFCEAWNKRRLSETFDTAETQNCITEILEGYGMENAEALYEKYFLQCGLCADVAKGEIGSVESLLKVISLFRIPTFFAEESMSQVKNLADKIYYNEGKNDLSAVPISAQEPIRRWLSEYQFVFTTNYDCVLDDAYEGEVKHLHGGFYIKDRHHKSEEKLLPEDAYLVWGIDGEDKKEQTRGGPLITKDGKLFIAADRKILIVKSLLETYIEVLRTGFFGELDIFGYSGENDQHINLAISQNPNLKAVCYYCAPNDANDKNKMNEIMRKFKLPKHMELILRPWTEIWDRIPIEI